MQRHAGILHGFGVFISDEESIKTLHAAGFGKGILSRSSPNFFSRSLYGVQEQVRARPGKREAFHAKEGTTLLGQGDEKEFLQLSVVEAFYLQDVGDCLSVKPGSLFSSPQEDTTTALSSEALWGILVERGGKEFVLEYCVYCHYRTMGWVVRGGLKFGVDFLLYSEGGPTRKHGELAVTIHTMDTNNSSEKRTRRIQNMSELQALSRVTETVAKGLLLCLVRYSSDATWSSPTSMNQIEIEDHVISRWDPTKTR